MNKEAIVYTPDVADLLMYALDNGKHGIHICYCANGVDINIYPVKEKTND